MQTTSAVALKPIIMSRYLSLLWLLHLLLTNIYKVSCIHVEDHPLHISLTKLEPLLRCLLTPRPRSKTVSWNVAHLAAQPSLNCHPVYSKCITATKYTMANKWLNNSYRLIYPSCPRGKTLRKLKR